MIRLVWPEELWRLAGAEAYRLPAGRLGELAGHLRRAGLRPLAAALLAPRAHLELNGAPLPAEPELAVPDGAELALVVPPLRPEDHVPPERCRELVEEGARLVDVRERDEFAWGHIPGAENRPLSAFPDVFSDLLAAPAPGEDGSPEPVFVCRSGHRTLCALTLYRLFGREDGKHLLGGVQAWQQIYPIEGQPVA
ncbi:MAG: rhodanese-like domain-containing protein [Bacillota bacterium]|nr:rhodanese-like domain-containing protein [Bacillota bacterium]